MAWIYLAAQADSRLPWCPGCDPSPIVKSTPTAKAFFFRGWQMAPFQPRPSGTTCEHFDGTGIYPLSTSSMEARPARILALREVSTAWRATEAKWFSRCLDWSMKFDQPSCSWKTSLGFASSGLGSSSVDSPRSGMTVDGTFFPLMTWERRTRVKGCGLWPTPTARDYSSPGLSRSRRALERSRYAKPLSVVFKERHGYRLPASFCEYLMGYAPRHTVSAPWAMLWFRSARAKRSVASLDSPK